MDEVVRITMILCFFAFDSWTPEPTGLGFSLVALLPSTVEIRAEIELLQLELSSESYPFFSAIYLRNFLFGLKVKSII